MDFEAQQRTLAKVERRLLPFLMLLYFVSFLDRVNVGFAALTMNKDLGFSATVFGWGAGIFFLGYFIFEVPSNVMLERVGARVWIARIMISWGLVSAAMAATRGEYSFYGLRFLLGVAEAGFFPGIILYLTYWFPAALRGRITGTFMVAIAISGVIGSPLSSWILTFDGMWGLKDWQLLFILEGVPAVVLGIVVLFYLTDRPEVAHWLEPEERAWLASQTGAEDAERAARHGMTLRQALTHPRVLALSLVYFGFVTGLYGVGFWLPQIVKGFGLGTFMVGVVAAIPPLVGAIGMVLWGKSSDRSGERVWHVAVAGLIGFAGLAASAYLSSPTPAVVALSVAALGIYAGLPIFWSLPTAFLSRTAAAGGIALINSIGNLSGFLGPYMVGWLKDRTGSFTYPLLALSAFLLLAALLTLALGQLPRRRGAATA